MAGAAYSIARCAAGFALAVCAVRGQDAVFRVDVDLVNVPVQVTTLEGALVRDLRAEDFELFDNGVARAVDKVWFDTDLPLTVGVLMDVSDSQQDRVAEQQQALSGFFRQLLRPEDRAFVVSVGMDVMLTADLTGEPARLIKAVEAAHSGTLTGSPLGEQCSKRTFPASPPETRPMVVSTCGGTALWNGVWAALRWKLAGAAGRKALIVLSDGVDTGSTHSLKEAMEEAHRAEAMVYAIKYPRHPRARGLYGLQRVAEETGGTQYLSGQMSYAEVFQRIAEDLRNQYVLSFRPEGATGTHRLEVRVKREGIRVRARTGYVRSILP